MNRIVLAVVAAFATAGATSATAGTLFIGTDTFVFENQPVNYLMKATVNGANFVSQVNIPLAFPLNGLGDGPGFLYSGDPDTNTLRTIDYNGNLLTSVTAGFAASCCNEEVQYLGGNLYHAHWSTNIQQIDPVTGAVIQTFAQPDVVGLADVGGTMWITHWAAHQVGTWDPNTNVFTPVFTTPDDAGALAFDPSSDILWVGQLGGQIVPYSLTGTQLGDGFNPVHNIDPNISVDTIDGLTFQGEGTQTAPEPATLGLFGLGLATVGLLRRRKTA